MPRAQRTVTIHRSPAEVFAFFANPANDQRWRRHVADMGVSGPMESGAVVHQRVTGPGGRKIPADLRVTAYEPNARYDFDVIAGPVRPHGEFRFTSAEAGTQVSFSLVADLSGVKKWMMGRVVQRAMDGEVDDLDRAKGILEGTTPPT